MRDPDLPEETGGAAADPGAGDRRRTLASGTAILRDRCAVLLTRRPFLAACALFAAGPALFLRAQARAITQGAAQGPLRLAIDTAWTGTLAPFDAISVGEIVYAGYYNGERRLTVARIDTRKQEIRRKVLDSVFGGWDAHNYVTLSYSREGFLHVSGNMHDSPLIYARMLRRDDFGSLTLRNRMVGQDESAVTYPKFFSFPDGALGFSYRLGRSGNGAELIDRFENGAWVRWVATPLFAPQAGGEKVSAYHSGYIVGPDGFFHVAWVWRKNARAETNFHVLYARSRDLRSWQDSRGQALPLPLAPGSAEVVDPVGTGQGLYNNVKLGFGLNGEPVISYLKYDEEGFSQLFHARPGPGGWQIAQASDWRYRWAFAGTGTLKPEIGFDGVRVRSGRLVEQVTHATQGSGTFLYDPLLLTAVGFTPRTGDDIPALDPVAPGMRTITLPVRPARPQSVRGHIQWQTPIAGNNDKPRLCGELPVATECQVTSTLRLLTSQ